MTKIVVDTNIVFSTFLNINSRIGQVLLSVGHFQFFAPDYIRHEVLHHKPKIKKIANLTENEFIELYELILGNITVLNLSLIPTETFQKAEMMCRSIDLDDTAFVAVTDFIGGKLWTGDLKLINGLKEKGYKQLTQTHNIFQDYLNKETGK
jgi:predicted nucleic acid-binding protein